MKTKSKIDIDKARAAWDRAVAAWGKARIAIEKAYAAWIKYKRLFIGLILSAGLSSCSPPAAYEREQATNLAEAQALTCHIESLRSEMAEWERVQRQALAVIRCESGGRHEGVWGDGGTSYGIAQYQRRTFYYLARLASMPEADWMNREHQVGLLLWAIANGWGGEWTCYRRLYP